ncbi:tail fiber protein [Aeromonas sp. s4]|uniref:phage tail protein n=1 Tax=Aeromonas sp. s4 TaxID=3138486 RepID=UPI0034A488CA
MANLQEVVSWDAGVYQLETSDPVLGGPGGTSNKQAQALANRTAYLKKHMDDLEGGTTAAGKANKLTTARTIAVAGDVTGQASFDGSGNISITATYKNSGVVAGTYRSVTVDAKGNVTAGSNPTTLSGYGITDALPATGTAAAAQKLATARTIALAGDVTGQANFDGSGNISITATYKNSGVAAGTYRSVTVDAKGNITAGSNPTTLSGYGITDAVSSTQYATEATKGIAATATQAEVDAGTDDSKFVTAKKLMAALTKDIAANGYPAGAPIPWPLETPPDGYLMMTGQSFSAATYPKLALAYPALVLPDMRAEFIRGWDAGRGVDQGRAMLSKQLATGVESYGINETSGAFRLVTRPISTTSINGTNYATADYDSQDSIAATGPYPMANMSSFGSTQGARFRVRPRNIAFNYIVRAA